MRGREKETEPLDLAPHNQDESRSVAISSKNLKPLAILSQSLVISSKPSFFDESLSKDGLSDFSKII